MAKTNFNAMAKAKEKELEKLYLEREEKNVPVAYKLFEMFSKSGLKIGKLEEKDIKCYNEFAIDVIDLFIKEDIDYGDREFVFQLMLQMFENTKDIVLTSLNKSLDKAMDVILEEKVGKPYLSLKLKDVDNIIKNQKGKKNKSL